MRLCGLCLVLGLSFIPTISAQAVFAHVILGNNGAYDTNQWAKDIQLASSFGIDGFVLNFIAPAIASETQLQNAFTAMKSLVGTTAADFKLLFSLDYNCDPPWTDDDIISLMTEYGSNEHYFKVDNKPMLSTFEGPNVNDWAAIKQSIAGGTYFVPDWTSLGPTAFPTELVDGGFSWDMWPNGPTNISTVNDEAWTSVLSLARKSYMMGVAPWFYTDLPGYNKAWVWRGDDMWYRRWTQVLDVLPQFVEIVSWNDFGESHYVGPVYQPGIPTGSGTDASIYVDGYPHSAWLETLPYQIAAYKHAYNSANAAPRIAPGGDKIVAWYRRSPASAGTTDVTGNCGPSPVNAGAYQRHYPVSAVLEDAVFAIVLASKAGTASIAIGDGAPYAFDNIVPGINFISRPFAGDTGPVTVTFGDITMNGLEITAEPADGVANFNAWVGCAGACKTSGRS